MVLTEEMARWLSRLPPAKQLAFKRQEEQASQVYRPGYVHRGGRPKDCPGPHPEGRRRATGRGLCDYHRAQADRGEELTAIGTHNNRTGVLPSATKHSPSST